MALATRAESVGRYLRGLAEVDPAEYQAARVRQLEGLQRTFAAHDCAAEAAETFRQLQSQEHWSAGELALFGKALGLGQPQPPVLQAGHPGLQQSRPEGSSPAGLQPSRHEGASSAGLQPSRPEGVIPASLQPDKPSGCSPVSLQPPASAALQPPELQLSSPPGLHSSSLPTESAQASHSQEQLGAPRKKPAAGVPLKRPAAVSKEVEIKKKATQVVKRPAALGGRKKPAAAVGESDKKLAVLRLVPVEERARFESGCSRCRWVPECTLSCWRQRGYDV